MTYSIEKLIDQNKTDLLFFWGHRPGRDGSITKSCMSQWWPADFTENGKVFRTAEHYMMFGKAMLFNDSETAESILAKESPKDVKDLGRQVKNFDPALWDEKKYEIVRQGNLLKFGQNEELKNFLLHTGNSILVEASPVDPVWGIGLAEEDSAAKNPAEWRGENLLGFALMEVRDLLK